MKISSCKNCHAKVSLFAKTCPACGSRVFHPVFGVFVALILISLVFGTDLAGFIFNDTAMQTGEEHLLPKDEIRSDAIQAENEDIEDEYLILGPGTYVVGEDIPAGKYDCIAASGFGVLRGEVASAGEAGFVQTMGNVSSSVGDETVSVDGASSYSNLLLQDGDTIYIEMNLSVEFIQK